MLGCSKDVKTLNKIEFIEQECIRNNVEMKPPKNIEDFLNKVNSISEVGRAQNLFFEEIEKEINEKEDFIQEQVRKEKDIFDSYILLKEYKKVLELSKEMMIVAQSSQIDKAEPPVNFGINAEGDNPPQNPEINEHLLSNNTIIKVSNVIGTIEREEKDRFNKMVFRATRGNALTHFRDFDKPLIDYSGKKVYKTVYVVMYPDGESVKNKIEKI